MWNKLLVSLNIVLYTLFLCVPLVPNTTVLIVLYTLVLYVPLVPNTTVLE